MSENHSPLETRQALESFESFERAMRRLMWLEKKRMGRLLREHNLTVPQYFALASLAHAEQGCAIGDLAAQLFQSNATMTGIVDRLEEERLVSRTRDGTEDRRKVLVQVTGRGRHLLGKAKESRRAQTHRVLAHFPPEELTYFVQLLNSYAQELEKESL